MTLASLQDRLATLVRQGEPIAERSESLALARGIATGNPRMTPADQVDVYREQFFLRHIGSLREDFPTVERLLGVDAFEAMCAAYLTAVPPTSFALRDASDRMAAFLERTAPYSDDALLRDCAAAEWAFIEAFDAADAPPLDITILATIDEDAWDRVKLHFHPSMRCLALSYPAHIYRTAVRGAQDPARPEPKAVWVVTFRVADDTLRWVEVEPAAFALLTALGSGKALGDAGEDAAKLDPEVGEKIGDWFQAWTTHGWISRIEL